MVSLSLVGHIHDSSTIVAISGVLYILDSSIRQGNLVLSNNVAILITSSVLAEVCVIMIIVHSILELEGIRMFIVVSSMTASMASSNYSSNNSTDTSTKSRTSRESKC